MFPAGRERSPPHVIFMFADDLGWNNLGFQQASLRTASPRHALKTLPHRRQAAHATPGETPEVRTPAIDALARDGLLLKRMYSYKYCSPTRSSFLINIFVKISKKNVEIMSNFFQKVHQNLSSLGRPEALKKS